MSRRTQIIVAAGALVLAALAVVLVTGGGGVSAGTLAAASERREMIDVKTGDVFVDYLIRPGDSIPYLHPDTGEPSLYPAELCFWTEDGLVREEPVYVLLNTYKGETEPTRCPDCGRVVRMHNPFPDMEAIERTMAAEKAAGDD
ncbi:MAG: hypothetical protein AAF235_00630 [Planctomycetota bacterium]